MWEVLLCDSSAHTGRAGNVPGMESFRLEKTSRSTKAHPSPLPSPHLLKNLHGCFRIKFGEVFGPSGTGGCSLVRGTGLGEGFGLEKKKKSRTKPGSCWFVFSVLEGKVVEQKNGENPGVKPHPLFREAVRHLSDN